MGTTVSAVAQTNLQLYRQLREIGWRSEDVVAVRNAYELAMELFAGRYRASGKPFVDHLVGTASAAAMVGCRPAVVIAGLLHATYEQGVFADGTPYPTRRHRAEVAAVAGDEAESLVYGYAEQFGDDDVVALTRLASELSSVDRDYAVLRLANEVDDRLDRGMAYSDKARLELAPMIELAEALGEEGLAQMLRQNQHDEASTSIGREMVSSRLGGHLIAPRSHWLRPLPALRRRVGRLLRAARQFGNDRLGWSAPSMRTGTRARSARTASARD